MRAAYRWSSSPCSQSQRTLSPHKSAFVVPQDATRLNQGHCGSPEDNPVFTLPASDPASPNPEGSASRGNPSLVPWMYHDGATAGLVSRMAIGLPIQSTFKVRGCSGWPGLSCNDPASTVYGTTTLSRATLPRKARRRRYGDCAAHGRGGSG
jgi:hypothetical protein